MGTHMSREFRLLSTFRRGLIHRVSVRHAISGDSIPSIGVELVGAPPEWNAAIVNGDIVVAAPLTGPASEPPDVAPTAQITIEDPAIELYLDTSGPALTVTLDAEEIERVLDPVPQRVEVTLLTPDGDPNAGQTVTIHATTSAASRTTTETGEGVYQTDLEVFTPSFHRFRVRSNGTPIGTSTQLNNYQTATAVTVVDS